MSLTELKEKAFELSPAEKAELIAFLSAQLRRDDPEYRSELARLIDDKDSNNWIPWDGLKSEKPA